MTDEDKRKTIVTLERAIQIIQAIPVTRPCIDCTHGEPSQGRFCELYGQDIPESWQKTGCDNWQDVIPF